MGALSLPHAPRARRSDVCSALPWTRHCSQTVADVDVTVVRCVIMCQTRQRVSYQSVTARVSLSQPARRDTRPHSPPDALSAPPADQSRKAAICRIVQLLDAVAHGRVIKPGQAPRPNYHAEDDTDLDYLGASVGSAADAPRWDRLQRYLNQPGCREMGSAAVP